MAVTREEVDPSLIEKEKEIYRDQMKEQGKPDNIIEKMVDGRLRKFLAEITLMGQPFVKDPDVTVEQLTGQTMLVIDVDRQAAGVRYVPGSGAPDSPSSRTRR